MLQFNGLSGLPSHLQRSCYIPKHLGKYSSKPFFNLEREENVENSNNYPLNIRFVAKTSDIRNFSQNIRSDVKTLEVATLLENVAVVDEISCVARRFQV